MHEPKDRTHAVIGAAIEVHRQLGPGLYESAYVRFLELELTRRSIPWEREVQVDLRYRGQTIKCAYRADLVVDGSVLVEAKAVHALGPIHTAQALTYMRLLHLRWGLLLNFHQPSMRMGTRRLVL